MRIKHQRVRWLFLLGLMLPLALPAGNVDLATVPERRTVQLTIYNAEDLTLVQETRTVTFKKGISSLQFSWANTLIDPTSVELQLGSVATGLELLDTTFPHGRPQTLYWRVQSETNREATIEISYFTSGITWAADYRAIAMPDERTLRLESFVRVTNNSGEDYENARVRLVVGKINLVEKIARLAKATHGRIDQLKKKEYRQLRQQAARKAMSAPAAPVLDMVANSASLAMSEPKEVIKEGLSEYFIYTIEGTETVPNGWAKRLRSFEADDIPMTVKYRYRPREYGDRLVRLYLLKNDKASQLGMTPLPNGVLRIFRANEHKGLSYLATQSLNYVPIGDKIEMNLGTDPNVIFELVERKVYRDNFWFWIKAGKLYRKLDEDSLKLDVDSQVAGWDEHTVYQQRIRNYSPKPINVQIRRRFIGDTVFRSQLDPGLHDFQTVQFEANIPAGDKRYLDYEIIARMGYNKKQDRVQLHTGKPGN